MYNLSSKFPMGSLSLTASLPQWRSPIQRLPHPVAHLVYVLEHASNDGQLRRLHLSVQVEGQEVDPDDDVTLGLQGREE